jgi:hypothetical protein
VHRRCGLLSGGALSRRFRISRALLRLATVRRNGRSRGRRSGEVGWLGAAPVVTPGEVLLRGVTSRMPGGAAGLAGVVCAVFAGGSVEAWFTLVLFKP